MSAARTDLVEALSGLAERLAWRGAAAAARPEDEDLLQAVASSLAETLGTPDVAILVGDGRMGFVLRGGTGRFRGATGGSPRSDTLAAYALALDAPVVCDDLERERRFDVGEAAIPQGARCGFSAPIPGEPAGPAAGAVSAFAPRRLSVGAAETAFLRGAAAIAGAVLARERSGARGDRERQVTKHFLESAPLLICGIAPDGTTTFVNQAVTRATGYRPEDLVGRNWWRIFYPGDEYRQVEKLFEEFREGQVTDYEMTLTTALGDRRVISWTSVNRQDETGALVEVIGFGRDVTGAKRVEYESAALHDALQQAAAEWRQTFDAMEDALIVVSGSGHVVRLNRRAAELSGRAIKDAIGLPLEQLDSIEPWSAVRQLLTRHEAGSTQVQDGASGRTWFVTASGQLGFDQMTRRRIVYARDVTQVVELEASLRRSEAMSELGALVGGVAHQVRNPLFAISSVLDALAQEVEELDSARELMSRLKEESLRLQELMRDLLEYARPTTAPRTLEAPAPLLELAIGLVRDAAANARVEISLHASPSLPQLQIQRDRLVEALENVIRNAVQHSPQGGRVQVAAEPDASGRWLVCRIDDSGRGFPPDSLSHVFEPFFTRRQGGTGLGLAIARRIVEEHEGQIRASNLPAGGRIEIALPRPDSAADPVARS